MRIGSRMAALASGFLLAIWVSPHSLAQEPRPAESTPPANRPKSAPSAQSFELRLVIAGLGRDGCDVDVKPGNPSCKFRAVNDQGKDGRQHVPPTGQLALQLKEIEIEGADRTCSLAITIHEPGQPRKTIYRGFRFPKRVDGTESRGAKPPVPSFTCYLSSPSRLARAEGSRSR